MYPTLEFAEIEYIVQQIKASFRNDRFCIWFGLFFLLIGFHFLLQSRSYHVWPDWDSASHLYYAFLRRNAISVLASYSFGIKWGLPRLYQVLGKFWLGKFWDHRILNTIAGAVLLAQFAWVGDRGILPDDFLFLLCVVLVINSLYVNYQPSATEFLDTPFLLLVLTLSHNCLQTFYC